MWEQEEQGDRHAEEDSQVYQSHGKGCRLDAVGLQEARKVVVTIWVEVPTGVVVGKGNIGSRVCAIHEGLAPGALSGVVVVAVDSLAKRFWNIDTFTARVDLAGVPGEARTPNAREVIVIIRCAADGRGECPTSKTHHQQHDCHHSSQETTPRPRRGLGGCFFGESVLRHVAQLSFLSKDCL